MRLADLIYMTRLYARDNNSYMFSDTVIKLYINQAIDRIKQYNVFKTMPYLEDSSDEPELLPLPYHYMLALFASSRCFDSDERFYEGTEKRNEFESLLDDLIADIQAGNIIILDGDGSQVKDETTYMDQVKDVYFTRGDEDDPSLLS